MQSMTAEPPLNRVHAGLAMVMQGQTHCSGMSLRGTFDW